MERPAHAQAKRIDARKRRMHIGLMALALVGGLWWGAAHGATHGAELPAPIACTA